MLLPYIFVRNPPLRPLLAALISLCLTLSLSTIYTHTHPPPPTWRVRSEKLKLTLKVSGNCRAPFTYIGVDTRAHLLKHYDIRGIPSRKHSKVEVNWARVVLIKHVLDKCKHTDWVVYSDTDAYIPSRDELARKLHPIKRHMVYQRGSWSVNAGFHAWKNSKEARLFLERWFKKYKKTNYFFAEQKAMLETVNKWSNLTEGHFNGFLGWHIKGTVKGDARFKTDVARVGRRGCSYEGEMKRVAVGIVVVLATIIAWVRLKWLVCGLESARFEAVGAIMTHKLLYITLLSIVLGVVVMFRDPGWKLYSGYEMSVPNFTHVLPRARRVVFDHEETGRYFVCSQFWCVKGRGRYYHFWDAVSRMKRVTLAMFVVVDVLDKTAYGIGVAVVAAAWVVLMLEGGFRIALIAARRGGWSLCRRCWQDFGCLKGAEAVLDDCENLVPPRE